MEINFDALVGPTHHYAGLSFGNVASLQNARTVSHPKQAALEGLEKMALLMRLGIPQAVLPPQARPNLALFRTLGFYGTDIDILQKVYKTSPRIFSAGHSAASMWAANAATISPSVDSLDNRVHFTVANLMSHFHRAQEARMTYKILKKIFANPNYFKVHTALPGTMALGDEGAANHNRFCAHHLEPGIQLFVFGKNGFSNGGVEPKQFPARQTLEASEAVARLHRLDPTRVLFAKQNAWVIDQGVFHNDVASVSNQNVFLYHELAFEDTARVMNAIKMFFPENFYFLNISESELDISESVSSYFFNSQLVTLSDGFMSIIAPQECQRSKKAHETLLRIIDGNNPVNTLHFVNCRESMKNGGGPACLRLRVVLTEEERNASHPFVYLTENLYATLVQWVNQYYREFLSEQDLLDPLLLQETHQALDALTDILHLGSLYDFQ